ncbi:MAG: putative exonuclease of the beta-lactamase fold involved in RNA processing [Bacteroidetes bacterium]|nr:MAG: putative exonuclease of the beta-lactamase fold involved in RNA processing [Bacteroidota bacterium]
MGAARTVTGSRHLVHVNGKKILLDCGMFQDKGSDNQDRNQHFGFDPASVDYVILSHAHIDHSGCLPRLVKDGFSGPIFATPATIDLCAVMLADSAHIQENDVAYINKKRKARGQKLLKPIYTEDDVLETMKLFVPVHYREIHTIEKGISFRFTDAGHILGSAAVHLELKENNQTVHLTFTGDIGRYHDLILKSPETFPQADYIIAESTYGDRLHDATEDAMQSLLDVVKQTCVEKQGKLIIPAFSLGRTQEIVYTLNMLWNEGKLPRIKVFVDSPLSVNATEIMRQHSDNFNDEVLRSMQADPDPFGFSGLEYIHEVEDSKALNNYRGPCIIISASGMLEAGRIKHHVMNNIGDLNNTILLVGYCPPHTLGGQLLARKPYVKIFGKEFEVRAEVTTIGSYSAHADYKEMIQYLSCQDKQKVKKIFLVHGEPPVQEKYREHLKDVGFHHVEIPDQGSRHEL